MRSEALDLGDAPEPGDREPKPSKPRTPRATSQKTAIEALLQIPNTLLLILPATREDALTEPETDALATALDHYQQKDERARRALHRILAASTVAELFSCLLVLAIPRLARHGLLPAVVAQHLANYAAETAGQQPPIMTAPVQANGHIQVNPYTGVYE
jgi:hypothetical protein